MAAIKLTVDRIQPGLHIRLPLKWNDHPFLLNSFKIKDQEQVEMIRHLGVKFVYFNPDQAFTGAALFQNFKNIYSVRLVEAVLPSVVQNSAYVSLVIPEIYEHVAGTNDILRKSFAILIPERVVGNFVHCRIKDNIYCSKKFIPAKANFNKWTIELYQSDGTLINLGTDTSPPTAPDSTVQASLIFELKTVEHNRSKIISNII